MFGNKVGHLGRVGSLTLAQRVSAMFSRGEPGAWYDPSDLSTVFQDAAGTVPAYQPGQGLVDPPVGRILDKSGRGNHATQVTTTSRPTLSARYNLLTGTDTLSTQSVSVVAGTYVLSTSGTGSVTLSGASSGTYSAGSRTISCSAGTLTLTVTGSVTLADLRAANDGVGLPPYQHVVDASTYDTLGFPAYLKFDGVDDWLQTASVNFSTTDKMFVSAAIRKLSDAAIGCLVELSIWSGVSGGVSIQAPRSASNNLSVALRDASNVAQYSINNVASPASLVLSAKLNISAVGIENQIAVRMNGGLPSLSVSSSATVVASAFVNASLYIGRRGGTSQPFNGRIYSLLIRGAATPDATLANVESYLNQKARVY